jgi:thiol:disulfide interchange protein DsbD
MSTYLNVINDYEAGLEKARIKNKPIFLYFTLHGSSVRSTIDKQILGDWETYNKLKNEFINVWLYADDRRKIEPYISASSGRIIRTIGHKWADLQEEKFGEQSQPLFIIMNAKGEQVSSEIINYAIAKNGGLLPFLESIE